MDHTPTETELALAHLLDLAGASATVAATARDRTCLPRDAPATRVLKETLRVYNAKVHALVATARAWRGLAALVRAYNLSVLEHEDLPRRASGRLPPSQRYRSPARVTRHCADLGTTRR